MQTNTDQRRKLTWADKVEIHRRYTNRHTTNETLKGIADEYDVSRQTAGAAVKEVDARTGGAK